MTETDQSGNFWPAWPQPTRRVGLKVPPELGPGNPSGVTRAPADPLGGGGELDPVPGLFKQRDGGGVRHAGRGAWTLGGLELG
jgi:hypothetical protein